MFGIIADTDYLIQNMQIPVLACYWWECPSKITEPNFFCVGNLLCFVNVELLDHPAAFCMSFILKPALFALLVEELLVEWVVKTVMSIPASSMNALMYLAIVAEEIGLCGGALDIINCLSFPVKWFLSSSVHVLYSSMQAMIQIIGFSGEFVNLSGSWCLPGLDVFKTVGM